MSKTLDQLELELSKLERVIAYHNDLYHNKSEPEISDSDFDSLLLDQEKLQNEILKKKGTLTDSKTVGAPVKSSLWEKKKHEVIMGSLDKVKTTQDLIAWCKKIKDKAGSDLEFLVTEKLDGIAVSITYENGDLISVATRGDGLQGEEILENGKNIKGIPHHIEIQERIEFRGELVIPFLEFNLYWKNKGKANPRNTVAGLCKGRSSKEDLNTVIFVAYKVIKQKSELKKEKENLNFLSSFGFRVPRLGLVTRNPQEIVDVYNLYDTKTRDEIPWLTDGLVITVNSQAVQEEVFIVDKGYPEYAVAIKPTPTTVVAEVTGITWNMGLSGRMCPVAQVEPIEFGGTTLRNVNMFNLDFIYQAYKKGFGVGSKILVTRTGDVLPYYKGVVIPAPENQESLETYELDIEPGEEVLSESI